MKRSAFALSVSILSLWPGLALAQAEHDAHHPDAATAQPQTPPQMGMAGMPEQCLALMQSMPQNCMQAMQQMMHGGMMNGGMHGGAMPGGMMSGPMMHGAPQGNAPAPVDGAAAPSTKAYVEAMDAMHGPMMDGVMAEDADIAFVKGMIPHHQGAIDMARIVEQYGDDPQTKAWAAQIIAAQQREIAEMEAWLVENDKAANGGAASFDLGQTTGTVYSADEGSSTISAIDLGSGAVRGIPVPVAPHNVDLTPDGRFLLAVGTPAAADHGGEAHGHGDAPGALVILDPHDLSKAAITVTLGAHPAHVVADAQGRAFASLSGANEVAVVDLAAGEVIERIATGAYPHGLRLSPDGAELYVANVEDSSVSVIGTARLTEVARIPVGAAPVQVGFTPAGDQVYVSLRDENRVAVIDPATRTVKARIDVGPKPIQMIATPDGRFVYVANQGSDATPNDTVSVIDTATNAVTKTITTGAGAHGVSVSADGAYVFVTNIADDSVSILDTARQEVVVTAPVGDRPNGIAYGAPAQ